MSYISANARLGMFLLFALTGETSLAKDENFAITTAKWDLSGSTPALIVNTGELLTPAQRDIINSGFSTFTLLAISDQKINDPNQVTESKLICSVKYDTWEERYQLIRVEPAPIQTLTANDYKTWAAACLDYKIVTTKIISRMVNGGKIFAILQVRQSSPDEGAKIKNWLVQQQSGFMQGLYAHMLGDFQFRGTLMINIDVPAKPQKNSEVQGKKDPGKKGQ